MAHGMKESDKNRWGLELRKIVFYLLLQDSKIFSNNYPNKLQVNGKVIMNENVSHLLDELPRRFRMVVF